MFVIQTFIKDGERFVPIKDAGPGVISDPYYIEGAVQVRAGRTQILNIAEWDYIDQLWSYWIDAVKECLETGESSFYFPDQPILVSMRFGKNKDRITLESSWSSVSRSASVGVTEFMREFCSSGESAVVALASLDRRGRQQYEYLLGVLRELRRSIS